MTMYLKDYLPLLEEAEQSEHLAPRDEEFIADLREKQEEFGDGTYISEKQLDWLKSIARGDGY